MNPEHGGTPTDRLTSKAYWEQGHGGGGEPLAMYPAPGHVPWWRRDLGAYAEHLVECRLREHLPRGEHLRFLEVGAAPGRNMVRYQRDFGYQPYGVEYTEVGVNLMNATLRANGIPEDRAILADFLSPEFQEEHRESFDVVGSFGFLEHFGNPRDVVRKHLDVLRPGGTVVVSIPNFRYVNYYLKAFYNRGFIQTHNFDLMDADVFRACFEQDDLSILTCGPVGSFRLPEPSHTTPGKRLVEKVLGKAQLVLNAVLMSTVGDRAPESRYFSSQLLCIGRKTGGPAEAGR